MHLKYIFFPRKPFFRLALIAILWSVCSNGAAIVDEGHIHFSEAVDVLMVKDGGRVTEMFETILDVSVHTCMQRCRERQSCDFINYHLVTHVCHFIRHVNKTIKVHIHANNGYAYGEKQEWNMANETDCMQCTTEEACVQESGVMTCRVTNCGHPVMLNNTVLRGNIFTVGSKITYSCMKGFTENLPSVSKATCSQEGVWSTTNIVCSETADVSTTTNTQSTLRSSTTPTKTTIKATPTTTTTPPTTSTTQTTSTTTLPPSFSCHGNDNQYRTITLSDGTVTTYRVDTDKQLVYNEARQKCIDENGDLLKVTTLARMRFIEDLTDCRKFGKHDLWINGKKKNDVWLTSDGDTIPLTSDFWKKSGDYEGSEECVRSSKDDNFKLNDISCDTDFNFICERIVNIN